MKTAKAAGGAILVGLITALLISNGGSAAQPSPEQRAKLQKMANDGNYKDAYDGFRRMALDPDDDPKQVGNDLNMALSALRQLGRMDEIDELRENVIKVHAKNWRLLMAAAQTYLDYDHHGFIIAGKFSRGPHRGGGQAVNSTERDRVRGLQLMVQAMPLAQADSQKNEVSNF